VAVAESIDRFHAAFRLKAEATSADCAGANQALP
jgi:hypothetical protein